MKIPGQPNVRMRYTTLGKSVRNSLWEGIWTVPAAYPLGTVDFRVLVHTKQRHHGVFQQAPVPAAQLTIVAGRPLGG